MTHEELDNLSARFAQDQTRSSLIHTDMRWVTEDGYDVFLRVPDLIAEVKRLRAALFEALEEFEYAATHKGDFLSWKHGDAETISRLRKLLH